MHLLLLSAWCPWPADNGSKLRIYHLLRGLGQRHEVDLLSFCPEPLDASQLEHLQSSCRAVQLVAETPFAGRRVGGALGVLGRQPRSIVANHSPAMQAALQARVATHRYDAILASQLHMAPYAARVGGLPWVLEELELTRLRDQVVQQQGLRRARATLTWWKTRRYLRWLLKGCAGVSLASQAEHALLSAIAPGNLPLCVVPNGVDVAGCADSYGAPEPDTLIYPGALSYDANFDAVAFFLRDVLPRIRVVRPDARLIVTGNVTAEQIAALPAVAGIEFSGYLDDVRPAVARAWAEVVPLRQGSGTRLKVLEALALGTPVIATSKGVEGLELQPERDLLVADDPARFAAQTLRLLGSPSLRQALAQHGRQAVQRYDWSQSIARLEELLEVALGNAPKTRGPAWQPAHSR